MASADNKSGKCVIISGPGDEEDVINIVNIVAGEVGIKSALGVRRIKDDEMGQGQFLVTLQSGIEALKFVVCKQCNYNGQIRPVSSRICKDDDIAEAGSLQTVQAHVESGEGPASPSTLQGGNKSSVCDGGQRDVDNGQNVQNQPMPQRQTQPNMKPQQGPEGNTSSIQGIQTRSYGYGEHPQYDQGMQMQHDIGMQHHPVTGMQPIYGLGMQPQNGQGMQHQPVPGIQPSYGLQMQHQQVQGMHYQQGKGIYPQHGQGIQHPQGLGIQPKHSEGVPQIHHGPTPHLGFQSFDDPRYQLGFRNQNQPGPRMSFQQPPYQDQYSHQTQHPYPEAGHPFNPGHFQNVPQVRGPQEGYQYQHQHGHPGFNPAFLPPPYGKPGSYQHHHQHTEMSTTQASSDFVDTSHQRESIGSKQSKDRQEPEVRRSCLVEVKDLPANSTKDAVVNYFENKRRSGGGSVKKVTLDMKRKSALIDFEESEDAENVIKRSHSINKKQVRVALHDEDEDKDESEESGDEEDKPSCTIEVRGFKEGTLDDTIEMYFENKRSEGGNVVSCERQGDAVFITFETHDVVERVLARNHEIDKKKLDVKLHKPKQSYKNRFLVSNLNMTTTKESLKNFMEARSRCDVTDVQYGDTPGIALVSFDEDNPPDLTALRDRCKKKELGGRHVELSTVPIADSILVTGLGPTTASDTILFYFEAKRSGNETNSQVTLKNEEEGHCVVQFEDHKVVDSVLKKKHEIDKHLLTLSLYIEGLGICQSSDEESWYKEPEPFTLDSFDKYKAMFIQKTKDQTLQTHLKKLHAELTWPTDDSACFKCTLTKETEDAVKKSRSWRKDVEKCFKSHLDNLEVDEVWSLTEIWEEVREGLASIKKTDGSEILMSSTKPKVVVVGDPPIVAQVMKEIKTVVSNIEEEVNRKKQEVTEKISNMKTLQLRLLLATGFHEKAKKKFKDIKDVVIKLKTNEIIFIGQVNVVNSCKMEMYEQVNKFCSRDVVEMSKSRLNFLDQKEVREFIVSKMKAKNIYGVWESEVEKLLILTPTEENAEAVIDLLNEHVREHTERLSPESFYLLESEKWTHLLQTLTSDYGNLASISSDQNRNIIIVATALIIDGIKVKIQTFISENSVYNRIITFPKPVYRFMMMHVEVDIQRISSEISNHKGKIEMKKDSPVIIVYGCKEGLDDAVHRLKVLGEGITLKKHRLQKDGIGKYIHNPRIKNIISETEKARRCVVELMYDMSEEIKIEGGVPEQSKESLPTLQGTVPYASCDIDSSRRIEVLMADMTTMNVDVIVNAANNRLDHAGGLARAISKQGGPSIQKESDDYTRKHKNLRAGDAVMTGAGRLPCKKVVHAVGPYWSGGKQKEERDLKEAILASLERAEEGKFTSIVFPALSTGIFRYPVDLATRHIVQAINSYFRDVKGSTLRVVYLVDVGERAVEEFVTALKEVYYDKTVITPSTSVSTTNTSVSTTGRANRKFTEPTRDVTNEGSIEVVLVQGQIANQSVDVIVNSTSNNLDLTHGTVSKSILEVGGKTLQKELRKNYPRGIKSGDIAITSGGNLNCKAVYHTCLSNWGDGQEEVLQQLVSDCLETASNSEYSSIAFPALGTGVLGFPRDIVARTLYSMVDKFNSRNMSLIEVRFVVYHGDKPTVKAFQEEDDFMKSGGSTRAVTYKPSVAPKPKRRSIFLETSRDVEDGYDGRGTSFTVDVKEGEINKEKADVLVNSTSAQLNLSNGGVSKALLARGGIGLQDELNKKYPHGIKPFELAVTSGGKLQCTEVYHTCLSSYAGPDSTSDLKSLVLKCLQRASDAGHTSICFPALGTGNLGYPTPVVAETMLKAMEDFQNVNKSLQKATVVIFHRDTLISAAFREAKENGAVSSITARHLPRPIQDDFEDTGDMSIGRISVVVKSGNLVKEPADCIINSTNINLDLNKGGVSSAIAKEGGKSLTDKCAQKANEMRQKGVISTTAIGLQCKYVIHVAAEHFGNNWKFVIAACLDEARALGDVKSVAFPILGTGVGHTTPQHMADTMATTISEFEGQASNVVEVRVVVFQQRMMDPFERQMRASIDTIGKQGPKSVLRTYRDAGTLSQGSVDLFVFSDDKSHIEDGIKSLKTKFDKELTTKNVKDEMICKLTDYQIKQLKKQFDVDLVVDRKQGQMKITGFSDQSNEANIEVIKYLREIEKQEKDTEKATLLSRSVQWCYMEKDAKGQDTLHKFDPMQNSTIEKAFEDKKKSIKVDIPSGTLEIDLLTLQGTLKKTKTAINILRRDLFKEAAFEPPETWAAMPDNENFKSHDVQLNGLEFNEVSQLFLNTVGVPPTNIKVLKVTRIQNRALYQQYTAKKKQIEKQNPDGHQNERRLWHGTSADTIESINLHGYNRSYCGKNATYYGQGVYFAVNSGYSAQGKYARPDSNGLQYMYLARVLTGVYVNGKEKMRTPPQKPGGSPTDLCDSVTNDVNNPVMFVVFNDTMAYPEYLVTFKLG